MDNKIILDLISESLYNENKILAKEFDKIFAPFSRKEKYEVVRILIEENIEIEYDVKIPEKIIPKYEVYLNKKDIKLSNEQLVRIYKNKNKNVLELLYLKNERFIYSRAIELSKRYKHKLDIEDLVSYGFFGLKKAADKFDISYDNKFLTYAGWWIDQTISRAIMDYGFTIRIPVHVHEKIFKLYGYFSENSDVDIDLIIEIISKKEGISPKKIEDYMKIMNNLLKLTSLNIKVGEEGDSELVEFLSNHEPDINHQVIYNDVHESLFKVISELEPREKDIIMKRFGFEDKVYTLEEIGKIYDVSRERIRQIESEVLKRFKRMSKIREMRGVLDEIRN